MPDTWVKKDLGDGLTAEWRDGVFVVNDDGMDVLVLEPEQLEDLWRWANES